MEPCTASHEHAGLAVPALEGEVLEPVNPRPHDIQACVISKTLPYTSSLLQLDRSIPQNPVLVTKAPKIPCVCHKPDGFSRGGILISGGEGCRTVVCPRQHAWHDLVQMFSFFSGLRRVPKQMLRHKTSQL